MSIAAKALLATPGKTILDALATPAVVAFSLRKLRSAYTGNCIQVRRSSDNTTLDIGFNQLGNLNLAQLMPFVGSGDGFVTKWYDQSGGTGDVSGTTVADQPRIVHAGVLETNADGIPGIFFGVNNPNSQLNVCFLINSVAPANYNLADLFMVHAAFEAGPGCIGGVYSQFMMLPAGGSIFQFLLDDHNGAGNGVAQYGQDNSEPVYENNLNSSRSIIPRFTYGKVCAQVRWNGLGETNETGVILGANGLDTTPGREGQAYNGWMMEFMIFQSLLSAADRNTLTINQQTQFKIQTSLPFDAVDYQITFGVSMRKIRHGYAGQCMNVRRSSDNTTQDIGFTAAGDLDLVALTAFVGSSNGFVVTWYDQSPWGNHVTQATTANQPQIVNAGTVIELNGRPVVFFNNDIATTTIGLTSATLTNSSAANAIFIVGKSNVTTFPSFTNSGPIAFLRSGIWTQAWFGDGGQPTWDSNFDPNHYVSVNGSGLVNSLIGPTGNLDTWITPTTGGSYGLGGAATQITIGAIPSQPNASLNGYIGEAFTPLQNPSGDDNVILQKNMQIYWRTPIAKPHLPFNQYDWPNPALIPWQRDWINQIPTHGTAQ